MKPFLTWLALGAMMFLCSCSEVQHYRPRVYDPSQLDPAIQEKLDETEPAMSYSTEIETLYNPDFSMSFAEDLAAFHAKVDARAEQRAQDATRLTASDLCRAMTILNAPACPHSTSGVTHLAANTMQAY